MKAYCSATVVSVGVALAGNKLVAKAGGGGLLGKVSIGLINKNELKKFKEYYQIKFPGFLLSYDFKSN